MAIANRSLTKSHLSRGILKKRETITSSSERECLTRDRGAAGSSLTGGIALYITMAMARRSAHLITYLLGNFEEAGNQYFIIGARVLDSRPRGRGFEPHRWHCIVPLSKTH